MDSFLKDNAHFLIEDHVQRMTTKEWKSILLAKDDHVVFKGCIHKLVAKNIGYGVVEVSKEWHR